jgi:hypothetical protein
MPAPLDPLSISTARIATVIPTGIMRAPPQAVTVDRIFAGGGNPDQPLSLEGSHHSRSDGLLEDLWLWDGV